MPQEESKAIGLVAGNIKRLRKARSLTQKQLAQRLSVEQPSAAKLEQQPGPPNAATLVKVAKALGCSVDELLEGLDPDYDALRVDQIRQRMEAAAPESGEPLNTDAIEQLRRERDELRADIIRIASAQFAVLTKHRLQGAAFHAAVVEYLDSLDTPGNNHHTKTG